MKNAIITAILLLAGVAQAAETVSLRSMLDQKKVISLDSILSSANLTIRNTKSRVKAGDTERAQTYYQGIPVWGYTIASRTNLAGKIDRLYGYIAKGIEQDVNSLQPTITEDEAITAARLHHESMSQIPQQYAYRDLKSGLYIYVDGESKARLAYMVSFFSDVVQGGQPSRPYIFVDALSGQVISYSNQLTYDSLVDATGPGGNEKTGKWIYGKDKKAMRVMHNDASNVSTMDSDNVITVDLNHRGNVNDPEAPIEDSTPYTFSGLSNDGKAINGAYSPLNDAHFNGMAVESMYKEWFGVSPLKVKLKLRVHFGNNFENAFWDGKSMTFGDGGSTLYPTSTALDVTGHEISHGYTEFHSALEYRSESGSMNEAYSDMAGEAVEYYVNGKNDWLVGGQIMKKGEALRYFDDPTKDKMSIADASKFKWGPLCDALSQSANPGTQIIYILTCTDMHMGSGIFNKAFYLMATAPGQTTQTAFAVMRKANESYWTAKSTFVDGAKGVRDAAKDLGFPEDVVVKAFAAVGVNI